MDDLIVMLDAGSALAACGLALAVITLSRDRDALIAVMPTCLIAAIALCDLIEAHVVVASFVAGLLPIRTIAGVPCLTIIKIVVLGQIAASSAVLLLLSRARDLATTLLLWLGGLALIGTSSTLARLSPSPNLPTLGVLEESGEILVTIFALLGVVIALIPQEVSRPSRAAITIARSKR